jgi:hypothetical protein
MSKTDRKQGAMHFVRAQKAQARQKEAQVETAWAKREADKFWNKLIEEQVLFDLNHIGFFEGD